MSHIPLLQDSPLTELVEALKHNDRAELRNDQNLLRLVNSGLYTASAHFSKDYGALHAFTEDWQSGRYFKTNNKAFQKLVSRTSAICAEANGYLRISSAMRRTKLVGRGQGLICEHVTSVLAQSTLDLSAGLLRQLKE